MKAKTIASLFISCSLLLPAFSSAEAAMDKVEVRLPSFQVTLNGQKIDSVHSPYPLLVYKDITYFPMTWNYARAMGLYTDWNAEEGLSVQSGGPKIPLEEDESGQNDPHRTYYAEIADFPVKVNGKTVDNRQEEYPLLLFKDITYFPMTWRFTHDEFGWETEWSDISGFLIASRQMPVLFDIVADDADSLYVQTGTEGVYRVSKALDGTFSRISGEEEKAVMGMRADKEKRYALPKASEAGEALTEKNDALYYNGGELLSLKPYKDKAAEYKADHPDLKTGIDWYASLYPLDDRNSLLAVTIYYGTHIPAPYTPHENRLFVVHDGKAQPVPGFSQLPNGIVKNADGTVWIYSVAPSRESINTRNYIRRGQLALIGKDGNARLVNELLQAEDIDMLASEEDSLLIRAYNDRMNADPSRDTDGFYRIDTQLNAQKLYGNVNGVAYAGQDGNIYVLNPPRNMIANVTTGQSVRWWDYELRSDLNGN